MEEQIQNKNQYNRDGWGATCSQNAECLDNKRKYIKSSNELLVAITKVCELPTVTYNYTPQQVIQVENYIQLITQYPAPRKL